MKSERQDSTLEELTATAAADAAEAIDAFVDLQRRMEAGYKPTVAEARAASGVLGAMMAQIERDMARVDAMWEADGVDPAERARIEAKVEPEPLAAGAEKFRVHPRWAAQNPQLMQALSALRRVSTAVRRHRSPVRLVSSPRRSTGARRAVASRRRAAVGSSASRGDPPGGDPDLDPHPYALAASGGGAL
jgi:hypothetical protein